MMAWSWRIGRIGRIGILTTRFAFWGMIHYLRYGILNVYKYALE